MKIKEITWRSRRDFSADYVCEHCGAIEKGGGYDDENYHRNVIPKMVCKSCGKTADESYRPEQTKYPEHLQV